MCSKLVCAVPCSIYFLSLHSVTPVVLIKQSGDVGSKNLFGRALRSSLLLKLTPQTRVFLLYWKPCMSCLRQLSVVPKDCCTGSLPEEHILGSHVLTQAETR